ncbi:hypothetical protein pb186bvf_005308 [Paramecium bursaria]
MNYFSFLGLTIMKKYYVLLKKNHTLFFPFLYFSFETCEKNCAVWVHKLLNPLKYQIIYQKERKKKCLYLKQKQLSQTIINEESKNPQKVQGKKMLLIQKPFQLILQDMSIPNLQSITQFYKNYEPLKAGCQANQQNKTRY